MSWQEISLGDAVKEDGGVLQTGPFGSQLKQSEYAVEGVPVIMPKDIRNGEIIQQEVARVPEATAERLARHRVSERGIVLPRRGEVSKRAFIKSDQAGWICGTGCLKIEVNGIIVWPKFLYYYLALPSSVDWLIKNAVGSTMLNLSAEIVSRLPLRLPSIDVQKKLADNLSNYDEAIENNQRRIQLLEESARLLYREWFVQFRFPGHEHVKVANGVPEGWRKKQISEVCDTIGGGTPKTGVGDYWDGDITWVVPSDITKSNSLALLDSERKITEKGLRESSAKMLPPETILMTSRASVGYFAIMDHEVCTNQGFINILPHDEAMRMYLLFNFMSRVEEIRANAKGTTYPEISKGRFRDMSVIIPTGALLAEFGDCASDVVQQVRTLKRTNAKLAKARDLLLPKLMSGELAA